MDLGERVVQRLGGILTDDAPFEAVISQINEDLKERVYTAIKEIEDEKMRMMECKQILKNAIDDGRQFLARLQQQGAAQYPVEIIKAERQGAWLEVAVCNFESWPFSKVLAREELQGTVCWVENVRVEPGLATFCIPLLMQPAGDSTLYLQLISARARPPVAISATFPVTLAAEPASLPREPPSWPEQ
jgi:hypothetical protein